MRTRHINPHLATLKQALPIIGEFLEPLLVLVVEQAVSKVLAQTRGLAVTLSPQSTSPSAASHEDTKVTLKQARRIIHCRFNEVVEAIRSGALPAEKVPDKHRGTRHCPDGRTIPGYHWRLLQSDVNQYKINRDLRMRINRNEMPS